MRSGYAPIFRRLANSEKFADLQSDTARTFYMMLLLAVDDWGRVCARPRTLNGEVWPMLNRKPVEVEKILEDLRSVGLIRLYSDECGLFLEIVSHEERAGSVGKRDHRKQSEWPETEVLAPLGSDWPTLAHSGPNRPSRAGARASGLVLGLESVSGPEAVNGHAVPPPIRAPRKKSGEPREPEPWRHALPDFPALDVPEFLGAMDEYMAHRVQHPSYKPFTQPGLKQKLRELAAWGVPRSVAAIRFTIGSNWLGIREDDGEGHAVHARNGHRPAPGADRSGDSTAWTDEDLARNRREAAALDSQPKPNLGELYKTQRTAGGAA